MARAREDRRDRTTLGIRDCDYVSVPVDRIDEAVRFYRDALGLKLAFILEDRWAEFDLGAISLALYPREPEEGRGGDIGLLVDDVGEEKTRLEGLGIKFPHGIEEFDLPTGQGRLARFRDPSGNRLELVERTDSSKDRPNKH